MLVMIRTLLIWLLVLAVPAQGAAAVSMALCGQAHHAGWVVHDGAEANAEPDCHGRPASKASSDPADHNCSACAACGSVGAILGTVPAVPEPGVCPGVFSAPVAAIAAFIGDGLDRPPRHLRA